MEAGSQSTSSGGDNSTTLSSNANLRSMSLDIEGVSPNFNKNVNIYNLVVGSDVVNIDVLAAPEDSNARIDVTGNTNVPLGASKISIVVTAQDGTKKTYTINVTKTENPDLANAKLENLAIENHMITPEFNSDITEYLVSVGSDVENLNVLAVPQREAANVIIEGKDNIAFGENTLTVTVNAEDGITSKVYTVLVHKKTTEEEEEEALLLRAVQETTKNPENITWAIVGGAIFILAIVTGTSVIIGMLIGKYKNENNKKI